MYHYLLNKHKTAFYFRCTVWEFNVFIRGEYIILNVLKFFFKLNCFDFIGQYYKHENNNYCIFKLYKVLKVKVLKRNSNYLII